MNYKTRNLSDHASAQCCVKLFDNGDIVLRSYATDVLYCRNENNTMICTGTYSATTRKHIGWFLREYAPSVSYADVRDAYDHDEAIVLYPGRIETRPYTDVEQRIVKRRGYNSSIYPSDFEF